MDEDNYDENDNSNFTAVPVNEDDTRRWYIVLPSEKAISIIKDWEEMDTEEEILNKCVEVLTHEGAGHTFAMHAEDKDAIRKFAARIPVSRFLVNTPAALGGIGATTGLFPALTLGCGAVGGSSSSNNISPMDLINIRRVAWDNAREETQPKADINSELVELLTAKILERLK